MFTPKKKSFHTPFWSMISIEFIPITLIILNKKLGFSQFETALLLMLYLIIHLLIWGIDEIIKAIYKSKE